MKRIGWLVPLLAVIVACAPSTPSTPTTPANPGSPANPPAETRDDVQKLNVAVGGLYGNPTPQASAFNHWLFYPLYDNLLQFSPTYDPKPSVAEKWELKPDGSAWVFTLRSDVKFSNGDPLTADDVAFTVQQILEKNWPQKSYLGNTTGTKVIDSKTIEFTLSSVDVSIPVGVVWLWILPKKYFESVGFDGFVLKPVGSGPYTLEYFKPTDAARYVKRSDAHPFRKPIATELNFRLITEPGQIVNGLRTGEIDLTANTPFNAIQADQVKASGLNLLPAPGAVTTIAMAQGVWEVNNTPLKDKRVRLAINYAIDKEAIAKKLFGGYAEVATQWTPKTSAGYNPNIKPVPYDPAKAKALLAEAGYPTAGQIKLVFTYSNGMTSQDLVVAIQGFLKDIGIEMEAKPLDQAAFVDSAYGRNGQTRGDISGGVQADQTGFQANIRVGSGCGKPVGAPPIGLNYCNPDWDKALDDAKAERDPAKRALLNQKANQIIFEDYSQVFVYSGSNFIASTTKIKGIETQTAFVYNFDSVYKLK